MRRGDIEAVSSFIKEAWREVGPGALGWSGATDEDIAEISSKGFLESSVMDAHRDLFIAAEGGRVVGMAVGQAGENRDVELSGIVVLQSLVGRGIGSRLFDRVEEAALARKARRITVKTEEFNERALSFYRGKGFRAQGGRVEKVGETDVKLALLSKDLADGRTLAEHVKEERAAL
jgi:ribosomal protein S18 acetylase RimI-like enzyme